MKTSILIIAGAILGTLTCAGGSTLPLIPKPVSINVSEGSLTIGPGTKMDYARGNETEAGLFTDYVTKQFGIDLGRGKGTGSIRLVRDAAMSDESYTLTVDGKGIVIRGSDAGIFYGLQTLKQLMSQEGGRVTVPYVAITDSPRFGYRGLMLDVCRDFRPIGDLKEYIDLMARYKFNTFHWHLTDDQGWRIEIKSHPELTRTGAWRHATQLSADPDDLDRLAHGGFYTQDQIREIIAYAAERHVTIIPEIDLPGHTSALLAIYPELSCTGKPIEVSTEWGIIEDVLCMGNEAVYPVIEDILGEVIELFPGEYINIGGDEAPTVKWSKCPKCRARMEQLGTDELRDLQNAFTTRLCEYVTSKGRKVVGWYEILHGGADHDVTILSWQGEQGGIEAAKKGLNVVMSPHTFMYLDYYQAADRSVEPLNITNSHTQSLEKVYGYEPYTAGLSPDQCKYIIGVQGNMWMEYIHSWPKLQYMAYPRVLAVAETGWSAHGTKDYDDFWDRMRGELAWLDRQGIMFRIPEPKGWNEAEASDGRVRITLDNPVEGARIYYSTDGRNPALYGTEYTGPLDLPFSNGQTRVQCIVKLPSGRRSAVYTVTAKR